MADPGSRERATIAVTCRVHGARGFCNLAVSKVNGDIELDPHLAGECVIVLDETAANQLFDVLGEWLG